MSSEVKICMFLTSNRHFQLKYKSSIHSIAFSSEKVVLSESGEKYALKKNKEAKLKPKSLKEL